MSNTHLEQQKSMTNIHLEQQKSQSNIHLEQQEKSMKNIHPPTTKAHAKHPPSKKSEANRWQLLRCRAEIITTSDLNSKKIQPKQTDVSILSWKEMNGNDGFFTVGSVISPSMGEPWASTPPPEVQAKSPKVQQRSTVATNLQALWQKCITNFGGYNFFEQS